jgi:hypothetical protein
MKSHLALLLASAALVLTSGAVMAHHSFAMFDQEHPMEVDGVVKDFKYTSPHSFIILDIKDKDGSVESWNLEGAPGGSWNVNKIKFHDGKPIAAPTH